MFRVPLPKPLQNGYTYIYCKGEYVISVFGEKESKYIYCPLKKNKIKNGILLNQVEILRTARSMQFSILLQN